MGRRKKEITEKVDLSNLDKKDILVDASFYKGNENLLRGVLRKTTFS